MAHSSKWLPYVSTSYQSPLDQVKITHISRHIILNGWSVELQSRLDSLSILIIGAGGLGSTLCQMLSGSLHDNAGITVMDGDVVELSNLHRQVAYDESMLGMNKSECLAKVCRKRNSHLRIQAIPHHFTPHFKTSTLFTTADVIFDCTDNIHARVTISDAWSHHDKKALLISASCIGWSGQTVTLTPGHKCCLRCVYHSILSKDQSGACDHMGQCAISGVMGPVVSIMANLQVLELFKWVQQESVGNQSLDHAILNLYDFHDFVPHRRELRLDPVCDVCLGISKPCTYGNSDKLHGASNPSVDPGGLEIDEGYFYNLMKEGECVTLDIREAPHYRLSRMNESMNFPASIYLHSSLSLSEEIQTVLENRSKNTTIVVVCRKGIDSLKFVRLHTCSYPSLVSLKGGLIGLGLPGVI